MADFICPVCALPLELYDRVYRCDNNHCFDKSKYGYVNLLRSNSSSAKRHGDDRLMIRARRDFLSKGYYSFLLDGLCDICAEYAPANALLIDAGVYMPTLDKVAAQLTGKPVTLALTHGHGDHVGSARLFPEVWLHAADTALLRSNLPDYQGEIKLLADGDVIDLGGRQIEVLYTPGHTFGSTNLLLFAGPFSALANTCERTIEYMEKNGIEKLYPGHYHGDNPETLQRVKDELTLSREVLSGKRKGEAGEANGLNRFVRDFGVTIRYNDPEALR